MTRLLRLSLRLIAIGVILAAGCTAAYILGRADGARAEGRAWRAHMKRIDEIHARTINRLRSSQ